jgi:hypothetical protein
MGQPSTVLQVVLLVLLVLPGIVYQFLRERRRGSVPGERNLAERTLRAITASILLDGLYAIVAGPQLVRLARGGGRPGGWNGFAQHPRLTGLWVLLLFVAVPAAVAFGVSWWERRKSPAAFRATPTAWDHMFRDRGSCFVRVRLKDGTWVGGWYGTRSFATSYPEARELFLQSAWRMNPDGGFLQRVTDTSGLHIRVTDGDVVELVDSSEPEDP